MGEKPIAGLIEKIAKECEEANADKWTITKIVKKLSAESHSGIKELRKQALLMLQQLDPKAAAVYASFQRMQVRTSSQKIERFDRGNIIKSLLRETNVARGVAEKIGREVEEKIKDLQIENISTPLIRELVNVKLLEYGHENIRNQYTRLGLPVFEVKKKAEAMPYSNKAVMAEYNLLRVIPSKLGRMHLSNQLFIARLQDFSTRPIALSLAPKIAETPKETVFRFLEKANRLSMFCSWQPNISALNVAVAAKVGKKTARDAALLFARASKALPNRKKVQGFNVMHLFEPEEFNGKGIEGESMYAAANVLLKAEETFDCAAAIDTKYKLQLLNKIPKIVVNCREKEFNLVNGIAVQGKGLCSFTALNLSTIALECSGKETAFFEELEKRAKAVSQLDELKRKELAARPYIKKQGIAIEEMSSALALDSLFEASKKAINAEKESEALSFSERVLAELKKVLPKGFVLTELRNKTALQRFSLQGEEEKHLRKSRSICKNYCFVARPESKKELNKLIEGNIRLIEFRERNKK